MTPSLLQILKKTMYMLRPNWNYIYEDSPICYVEDSLFQLLGTAIIAIEPKTDYLKLLPTDFNFPQLYPNTQTGGLLGTKFGAITTARLRTGYIENSQLVMSSRRINAGEAYLSLYLPEATNEIELNLSLWSGSEYFDYNNDYLQIQYLNNGIIYEIQNLPLHLLSIYKDNYYNIVCKPSSPTYHFKLYLKGSKIGDRNKGRVCIGNMFINMIGII